MKNKAILTPTPTFLYRHRQYVRLIGQSQDQKFLDIGTGTGFLLKFLNENNFNGDAIDLSLKALEYAKQFTVGSKIELLHTDFYKLTKTKKYDQIFCFEVLEYVKDPQKFINKIAIHLNPNGRLIISMPAHQKYWNNLDIQRGHLQRFEKEDILRILKVANFRIVKFYSYGFPFLNIIRNLNKSARFLKKPKTSSLSKESDLIQEYNPKLKPFFSTILLEPLFALMDRFLSSDKGVGFLIEAKIKPFSSKRNKANR